MPVASANNPADQDLEALRQRVRDDFPFWAANFGKIVDKFGNRIPLELNPGQLELDGLLEGQRKEGKPQRAIALKARQVGISTMTQGKLMHRSTLRERYNTLTVAHDRETGAKLYGMAETLYGGLPNDPELKPKLGTFRRKRELHFAGAGAWEHGEAFPDSRYLVDTAGEFEAGRGGTYRGVHGSEVAFWPQILQKLTALLAAVPDDPESLIVLESTANGFNDFKGLWDDAVAGISEWVPFFWPWWKQAEYHRDFLNDNERARFEVGDPTNPYAEEETDLVKRFKLTLEQLNWRRHTIANKCGGDVRIFHQEYPSTAEEAFISTGGKVFDPYRTAQLLVRVEKTDPKVPSPEHPGPQIGDFAAAEHRTDPTMTGGTIEVPTKALWKPRERGVVNPTPPWRLWLSNTPPSEYVIGVDVSGGKTETTDEPDYHAIQVLDLQSRLQVAEYRSRIDPDLLTVQVLLAALYFNNATVAVERTGSWGQPVLRVLWRDYHYPHVYRSRKVGAPNERTEPRLGWDTTPKTKPLLIAGMAELLRLEEDGIQSRSLADEVRTYTRNEKGQTEAEPGKYDDLLMAFMIAHEVARQTPIKARFSEQAGAAAMQAPRPGGVGDFDPRYR